MPEKVNISAGRLPPRHLIVMGVSGCGKTTVGAILADRLGCEFFDGDQFHPESNIEKMKSELPLNDHDRMPWLKAIRSHLQRLSADGRSSVLACSALKYTYRQMISAPDVLFVYLKGSRELIASRLAERKGHYMPSVLLNSQFSALEEPSRFEHAVWAGIESAPEVIADEILDKILAATSAQHEEFTMQLSLKQDQQDYREALEKIKREKIIERIWVRDHTVWRPAPNEIANRLGWLDIAERYTAEVNELQGFAEELHAEGFTHALLLGMGGSSLAPEVLRKTIGIGRNGMDLAILDSTDPGAVDAWAARLDLEKTVFIVATKSGGTVETFSFFKFFYNLVAQELGEDHAGAHFIAITDPGSGLVDTANRYAFRKIFLNDPNIGGRYSALSMFGLVPAALLGLDLGRLLSHALRASSAAHDPDGIAPRLGAAIGALAGKGRDKLTLLLSPELESFGDWVEQLVAESTGKQGKGVLPVLGESLAPSEAFGDDRLFVGLTLGEDEALWDQLDTLSDAGYPVIWMNLDDVYQLGGQFFIWEFATAVAGYVMGIQPFDQPNVESAKIMARKMVAAYQDTGRLPEGDLFDPSVDRLVEFLQGTSPGDYIAVQAYVTPTAKTDAALKNLQHALRAHTGCAVTIGYGPRFLHSTGQLHKGDRGAGRFMQFVSSTDKDLPIPDTAGDNASQMSFQVLKRAQALGDAQALREADPPRAVIQFVTGADAAPEISRIAKGLTRN